MNPEFMWDFSHIFPTREAFEKEFSDCSKEIDAIGNIRGHLGESPEALAEALNAIYGVFERFDISFDAQRIVFSYKKSAGDGFRIYSANIDGTTLR